MSKKVRDRDPKFNFLQRLPGPGQILIDRYLRHCRRTRLNWTSFTTCETRRRYVEQALACRRQRIRISRIVVVGSPDGFGETFWLQSKPSFNLYSKDDCSDSKERDLASSLASVGRLEASERHTHPGRFLFVDDDLHSDDKARFLRNIPWTCVLEGSLRRTSLPNGDAPCQPGRQQAPSSPLTAAQTAVFHVWTSRHCSGYFLW